MHQSLSWNGIIYQVLRNRLVKAGKVSYTYDCENTRIATEEGGITTEYVTDTGGSLSRLLIAYENIGTANTSETWI